MGAYTDMTRAWLDRRYARASSDGIYFAHQPIYGLGSPHSEPYQVDPLARTFRILEVLNTLRFESVLDVGGGEGYLAQLVRRLFDVEVTSTDLSRVACQRAAQLFDVPAVAVDSFGLPFADDSFDVVLCSEVVEHVEFPVETLLELQRVARRALLVTTEEVTEDPAVLAAHDAEPRHLPHAERNLFLRSDLVDLLGPGAELGRTQLLDPPAELLPDEDDPTRPPERALLESWIQRAAGAQGWATEGKGAIGLVCFDDTVRGPAGWARRERAELLEALLEPPAEPLPLEPLEPGRSVPASLIGKLTCPDSGALLVLRDAGSLGRDETSEAIDSRAGVPLLLPSRDPGGDDLDERLAAAGRSDPDGQLAERLRALRARLTLPDASDQLEWDFTSDDRALWFVGQELEPSSAAAEPGQASDTWALASTGFDPWLVGPLLALPADAERLVLEARLAIHNPDFPIDAGAAQVFWMAAGDLEFAEERSIAMPLVNDGQLRRVLCDLSSHPAWPKQGHVWLRFDPANGPCELRLAGLRLVAPGSLEEVLGAPGRE